MQCHGDAWDTKLGVRYVWTKGDLMRLKRNLVAGQKSAWSAIRELPSIGWDAIRAHHAVFDPLDPMPAVGTYLNPIIGKLRSLRVAKRSNPLALEAQS